MTEFEPNIVAFLCNWCTYAGADLAGTSRMKYPPNVRIVRVMCSSRVNPLFIANALQQGADGQGGHRHGRNQASIQRADGSVLNGGHVVLHPFGRQLESGRRHLVALGERVQARRHRA